MSKDGHGMSALSRKRLASLPVKRDKNGNVVNLKLRPQENPMCVKAFGGSARERGGRRVALPTKNSVVYADTSEVGVKRDVKVSEYSREYDNPEIADTFVDADGKLQWVAEKLYSNLHAAIDYVGILNNPQNRRKAYKPYAAIEYAESLRAANVCHTCFKPLKTTVATIKYGDREVFTDTVIATVKSHYEIKKCGDTGKYIFLYIDGTKRKIFSRKGTYGRSEFYLESGEIVHPNSEYRVERSKCHCGLA